MTISQEYGRKKKIAEMEDERAEQAKKDPQFMDGVVSTSEYLKNCDFEYMSAHGAAYVVPAPMNALSPYELEQILQVNSPMTASVIKASVIERDGSGYFNTTDIGIVALISEELVTQERNNEGTGLPNVIPLGLLRLREHNERTLKEPALSIVANLIASYASILTMQGYEILPKVEVIQKGPEETTRTPQGGYIAGGMKFTAALPTPFIPGKFNRDGNRHVAIEPTSSAALKGTLDPISRYEDALNFFEACQSKKSLVADSKNCQRLYSGRIAQALDCVAFGYASMAHAADYILRSVYETMPFHDYMPERLIEQSKVVLEFARLETADDGGGYILERRGFVKASTDFCRQAKRNGIIVKAGKNSTLYRQHLKPKIDAKDEALKRWAISNQDDDDPDDGYAS